jgi:hypothetical protein
VLWKALTEHNPMKLDLTQNSEPTANDNLSKSNYSNSHNKYYCKDTDPKIVKPVGHARYLSKLSLEIGFTHFQYTKLKFCI